MNENGAARAAFPRLPVLGWSSFSGASAAPVPGVLDVRHRRYTTSGRAAIGLALRVFGVRPGEKVLVPTYHCPTMVTPVVHAGAQPMFYPITAAGAPDLGWLERADVSGVRVLLAAHYFGLPQPMSAVAAYCTARGFALIEDCAHAFYGSIENRPVGSWGDLAVASLTKFFPVPEGGLLVSATRSLDGLDLAPRRWRDEIKAAADALEIGASYGRFPGLNSVLGGVFGLKTRLLRGRENSVAGSVAGTFNGPSTDRRAAPVFDGPLAASRLTLAARGIAGGVPQSRIVDLRRRNYAELAGRLSQLPGARVLYGELPPTAVPYVFPLYVHEPERSYLRLRSAGIPIFRWDDVWPGRPALDGDCGVDWSTRVFQLGCHQDLSTEDIAAIAATVRHLVSGS